MDFLQFFSLKKRIILYKPVNPKENVIVNIDFGKELGAYTVDVAYDNNLFEYVSITSKSITIILNFFIVSPSSFW